MSQVTEIEVFRACRTLFGAELQFNRNFLSYLQPAGVRSAYRKKAKTTHPDNFAISSVGIRTKQQRLFQDLNQAHQTVQIYLKQRKRFSTNKPSRSYSTYTQTKQRYQNSPGQQRRQQHISLPARPLQFGLFLYYRGIIPFNAVISAITWQRQQRPVLGRVAKRWGWLNDKNINKIIEQKKGFLKFGERAENLGLLTPLQVRTLLFHQRSQQKPMGNYFIEQGYFNKASLNQLLQQLAEHNQTYQKGFTGHYYYFHHH